MLYRSTDFNQTEPAFLQKCGPGVTSDGKDDTNAHSNCSTTHWPWRSNTHIFLQFLLVSHVELNESLLLDELTIFGQLGGNAGIYEYESIRRHQDPSPLTGH